MLNRLIASVGLLLISTIPSHAVVLSGMPAGTYPLPGTTSAAEPVLAGTALHDLGTGFSISDVETISGGIQNRVTRSDLSGWLIFSWKIFPVTGDGDIAQLRITGYDGAEFGLDANWRIDSTGDAAPDNASYFGDGSGAVNFNFVSDEVGVADGSSNIVFLRTDAAHYALTGALDVTCVPDNCLSGSIPTWAPEPVPGDLRGSTRDGFGGAYIAMNRNTGVSTSFRDVDNPPGEIEYNDSAVLVGSNTTSSLLEFRTSFGALVDSCAVSRKVTALEYVDGVLYGATNLGDLVIVGGPDPLGDCALTAIGPTGFTILGGLAYDGQSDTLYGCTANVNAADSGQFVTCDRTTGACTTVGPTGFSSCTALELGPNGVLYGGTGGGLSVTDAGLLITIDPATGAGTAIGPTGFLDTNGNGASLSGLSFRPPDPPEFGSLLATSALGTGTRATLLDLVQGAGTIRAEIPPNLSRLSEIEMRADGTLFAVAGSGGVGVLGNNIFKMNPTSGELIQHCTFTGRGLQALEFVGDTLYGVNVPVLNGPANLVTVGSPNAAGECPLTVIGATSTGAMGGLAYDEFSDTLYGCTSDTFDDPLFDSGVLYTCDRTTGACTEVGPTGITSCSSLEPLPVLSLAREPETIVYFMYAGGQDGNLYSIQPDAGPTANLIGPSGFGRPISGLAFVLDLDFDGVIDSLDNCPDFANEAPLNCDTDGDGFGNRCDGDLDNTGFTGFDDLFLFGQAFQAQVMGTYTPNADFDCSGFVNFEDLQIFGTDLFGNPPGIVEDNAGDEK